MSNIFHTNQYYVQFKKKNQSFQKAQAQNNSSARWHRNRPNPNLVYGLGQEHRKKRKTAFLCSNTDFIGINKTPGLRLWSKSGQLAQLKSHLSQCRQSQQNYLQFFQTTAKTNGNKIVFQFFMLYSLNIKVLCKIILFHKGGLFSSRHHLQNVFLSVS